MPFVFKNASDYPHAPWWRTEEDSRPSINPSGRIVGLLYKQKAPYGLTDRCFVIPELSFKLRILQSNIAQIPYDSFHVDFLFSFQVFIKEGRRQFVNTFLYKLWLGTSRRQ
ncbi:hypothetical protein PAECIP112173_01350 [Paenibacillus sp. JJ-100]|nr:hypothetical protein PAECIP112173_01350 [Paenibacillus sp. JJ-100]